MNNPTRTPVSRRSRPAKDPLSQEVIVKTAFDLLEREGSSGLSMRKIAKALDTGPSSLYVYVKNLEELSTYVLDYGLGKLVLPPAADGSWQSNLFDALNAYLTVLYESPGLAELALTTIPIGPHSLALMEYILARLDEGGASSISAAWGVDLLLLYTASVAFEQTSRDRMGTTLQTITETFRSLDPLRYPMIAALKDVMFSGDETGDLQRFRWGLEAILRGVLQTGDKAPGRDVNA
ncbi:TetR/AcrR family transcriptional regulator [Cohnella nanjingensis]|uniref:TetR/AcrR family transcriptional regulator n=1 Tax=Cohnella nanjingensis TaxID=1387779 RepID=A0A7X0VIB8_9BACL|nr:TetR/AcrR family transcriptional regulator [Cohnella nanjingensis]MBB6673509.1 TetR/AcrR family transcriptional regulator [Cohnella nanjingensis]